MSAVDDAVDLINQAQIKGIDYVGGNNLPKEKQDSVNETVVLITDAADDPAAYGNDDFWSLNQEIELQVWYQQELAVDPETIELALMKTFVHAHWHVSTVRQRVIDPTTQQLSNTLYFSRTKNLNGDD